MDLILLHGPSHMGAGACSKGSCAKDLGQWKAYEKLYKAGKAKAIGVSNYCKSCLECLLGQDGVTVTPAVNQIELHVGMGIDPEGLVSFSTDKGIVVQAYSPLGNGKLISDPLLASIGKAQKPPRTAAQIALKWVVQLGYAVATKADSSAYLKEDFDIFAWNMTDAQQASLSAATDPAGRPSWACTA